MRWPPVSGERMYRAMTEAEVSERAELTQYGFRWGAAEVVRTCSANGYVVISVIAECGTVDLIVTPKGNKITVQDRTRKAKKREAR